MKPIKIDRALDTTIDVLYNQASAVIEQARETAHRQVNEALVKRNWELGKLIADEELKGQDRAVYGASIIKGLAKRLTIVYGKGFAKTNLYNFTNFYKMFPKIFHAVSGKSHNLLSWTHYRTLFISSNA